AFVFYLSMGMATFMSGLMLRGLNWAEGKVVNSVHDQTMRQFVGYSFDLAKLGAKAGVQLQQMASDKVKSLF
ncbi:hypothetical protein KJ611_00505, partial [Patescibacteria group bacterium]|nr:hypothetical protein [Patescibacteria group bacterium]